MKWLGMFGCLLAGLGLIWGIFFRNLLTLAFIGLIIMVFTMIFDEEE